MKKKEYICPHIARLELWIQPKISPEEFQELIDRMDKIRDINNDQRFHYNRKKRRFKIIASTLFVCVFASFIGGFLFGSYHTESFKNECPKFERIDYTGNIQGDTICKPERESFGFPNYLAPKR